jgi:hypothetical protein
MARRTSCAQPVSVQGSARQYSGVGHGARHARDLGPARRARRFALLNRQAAFHIGLSRTDSGAFLRIGHTPTFTPGLILTRLEGRAALFQSRLSCMAQRVQATPRREKLSLKHDVLNVLMINFLVAADAWDECRKGEGDPSKLDIYFRRDTSSTFNISRQQPHINPQGPAWERPPRAL